MKYHFTLILLLLCCTGFSQRRTKKPVDPEKIRVDSMFVNLYTDSLKKGTYNYINVDGRLVDGRYIPLDSTEVIFTASDGKFHGNSLWIEPDFKKDKVNIRVVLKSDPKQCERFDLYIKQASDPDLKTEEEILRRNSR